MFLGCSWTWCIGMFLPVLLVRDLGLWGWIVFAIPNVVGAAAMGWVISRADASRRLVGEHRAACSLFSIITIAFHVFFVIWFVPRLVGLPTAAMVLVLIAVYLLVTIGRPGLDLPAAGAAWIISLAMFAIFLFRSPHLSVPLSGSLPATDALCLAPLCIFGFFLCPYLDLTFHRARGQLTAGQAKVSFGLGFGLCFLAMITFSLFYAPALSPLLSPAWRLPALGAIVATHLIVQSAFTVVVHVRSLISAELKPAGLLGMLVLAQISLFAALGTSLLPRYHSLDSGEVIYRLFMAFYGLVFPAYVWLFMFRPRHAIGGPSMATFRALLLVLMVAGPMYWMGFIEGRMIWLIPGLAVVLLSRFTIPRLGGHVVAQ